MAKRSDLFSTVGLAHSSDDELALSAQDGDRRAMEWLLDRYRPVVEVAARDYFWAGADAEDVVQEGMIGLYKAVRDYSPGASISFRCFARLCIRRQIITALKAATRHKHTLLNSSVAIAESMSSCLGPAVAGEMLADRDSG
ncbi:MAG: sigma-70 family RNA polymerase sigma factor, partial [Armatimonadetes bacterium]|nr:sigma-70 family RNA polymerase sigma factor [Armatimonadota bacterium]